MAADTDTKRYSAMHMAMPWRSATPLPDGSVSTGDRTTILLLYAGILPAALVYGPLRVVACDVMVPGVAEVFVRVPGVTAADLFIPGAADAHVSIPVPSADVFAQFITETDIEFP